MRRSDIVIVVLDTQRADRLSCYGSLQEASPNLDQFASDGTRYAQAVAPAQWTVPTHASLFTGLYPSQHTTCQMDSVLPKGIPTLAERLQDAGYYTAGFSHNPLIGATSNGLQRGFCSFMNYDYLGAGLLSVNLSRPEQRIKSVSKLRRSLRFLLAEMLGYSQNSPISRLFPFLLPVWKKMLRLKGGAKQLNAQRSLGTVAKLLIDRAGTEPDQPIFTFVNLMGTHVPYDPPLSITERFLSEKLGKRSANVLLQRMNNLQVDASNWLAMNLPESEYKVVLDAFYDAEVATQDAHFGEFITRLRHAGRLEKTLFIVVADHGDHLGEKNRINHTFGVYGQLTNVPLLIRDPSDCIPRGDVVMPFVSTRRVFHSVLAAVGLASPEEERLSLRYVGRDEEPANERGTAFAEAPPLQWAVQRIEKRRPGLVQAHGYDVTARAICASEHKLIATGNERLELFAPCEDPEESLDLCHVKPEVVATMRERLDAFIEHSRPIANGSRYKENDPAILGRLQALGYVE